jgi:disulfide bond formation protein DsbB
MTNIVSQNEPAWYRLTPARAVSLVLAASIAVLGAALLSQYVGGLRPCVLCLYQRVPYVLTIVLSGLALAAFLAGRLRPVVARWVLGACAAVFLVGAGIAAYHVGVEQGWWAGTASCTGPDLNTMTLEQLREHLLAAPIVRCDEVAWSLFGISMAGYNVLTSLALAGASLWLARSLTQRATPA